MWFLASYGRPSAIKKLTAVRGGMPDRLVVLLNEDDPALEAYKAEWPKNRPHWTYEIIPPGSRSADALRVLFERYPDEPFYGDMADDYEPLTPKWWQKLERAAGDKYISVANGEPSFPRIRNACVLGGGLVRAMGGLVRPGFRHNYVDDVWDTVAHDFDLLKPCKDVIVRHQHPIHNKTVENDETYKRGSEDIAEDAKVYARWQASPDRIDIAQKVAAFLGVQIQITDLRQFRLCIATPIAGFNVDTCYQTSILQTAKTLRDAGITYEIVQNAGGSHVGKARERLLWNAMETKPTHILFIDCDMGWDPHLVMRLMAADHDFVAAVGVRKQEELSVCCNFFQGKQAFHERTKFLEVMDVGFAFVLLKTSVIDQLCEAHPELEYRTESGRREWALFLDILTPEKDRLSEDLSFCRRWRDLGGKIYVDHEAKLIHAGRKEYTGKPSDFFEKV